MFRFATSTPSVRILLDLTFAPVKLDSLEMGKIALVRESIIPLY